MMGITQQNLWEMSNIYYNLKAQKSNDWKWTMANDYPIKKNGLKVFSCFAGGGGSTMGYKLAGCDVIGDLEIDKRMNDVYVKNHNPKYNYLMDIRDFNKLNDLPKELYELDILDGSPPCSTFSMAGQREKSWGIEKKFAEGQKLQTLDELFFIWIETVNKLRPKVAIAENVEGLLLGNATKYLGKIYKELNNIGYKVKHYLLKSETMGIPQRRHRVFFICVREDIDFDYNNLDMSFNYEPIYYSEIHKKIGEIPSEKVLYYLNLATKKENSLAKVKLRIGENGSRFNEVICWGNQILPTIHTSGMYCGDDKHKLSSNDYLSGQTFPQDYKYNKNISYICGMSVPPVMVKRIMGRLSKSGLFKYKEVK